VAFPSGTASISQVSAGAEHTCAVTTSNQLFCWGRNYWGQLGNGTKTTSNKPILISSTGIKQVASGDDFTCALLTSGGAQCWGYNYYGLLGNNSTTDSTIPVNVSNLAGATAIWAGDEQVCALVGSGLKCWGNNMRNQIYSGECMRTYNDGCTTPRDLAGFTTGVASASLGTQLICVLKTNGDVFCSGYNDYGQVGIGSRGQQAASSSAVVSNAISIGAAVSGYHVCAVISGGGVKCWGYNSYGQLGDGTTTDRYSPVDATAP
jgi:alpha-tubulin suppressor-like RCC1 family protein